MHLFVRIAIVCLSVGCFELSSIRAQRLPSQSPKLSEHTWPGKLPKVKSLRERKKDEHPPNRTVIAGLDHIRNEVNAEYCASEVLQQNPKLSDPVECARTCHKGEPPKTCYYRFRVEAYTTCGSACRFCRTNITDLHCSSCQCVTADGVQRTALLVNRMLPGPAIEVCEGDHVVIDVENRLPGMELSIHWHGVLQNGSQYYDGVPFITQCPIGEGNQFRYQWTARDSGTHFWHAHTGLQKMDGVYGSIIVRQSADRDVHSKLYDYDLSDHVVLISDWMHNQAISVFPGLLGPKKGQFPNSLLINGKGQTIDERTNKTTDAPLEIFNVKPNGRYRFRLINAFCTTCPGQITIQDHRLTIIASDGPPVEPVDVDSIISFAGERYDFVLKTDKPPGTYWIQLRGLGLCENQTIQQLALLRYEGGSTEPHLKAPTYEKGLDNGVVLNPVDAICHVPRQDAVCVSNLKSAIPIDTSILKLIPNLKLYLPIKYINYDLKELFRPNTYNRFLVTETGNHLESLIDGIPFAFPSAPILSQYEDVDHDMLCNRTSKPSTCSKNCECTHNIRIPRDAVVEVVLVDEFQAEGISHPFHLHGYSPYVIGMGRSPDESVKRISLAHAMALDRQNLLRRRFELPPAKDTIPVPNNGYMIFRFRARNVGYWLLHCHFIYHQAVGMDMVLQVGEQSDLPPVPPNFPKCGNFVPPIQSL